MASATAAGVVAKGAAFIPSVICEWTKPGRTTSTLAPDPARASPSPWAKPSSPAFDEPYTKLALRTRSPATLDSTTSRPWPWRRNWAASARQLLTAPV